MFRFFRHPLVNVATLFAVWAGSIVVIGFATRAAVWFFCLGFGCNA